MSIFRNHCHYKHEWANAIIDKWQPCLTNSCRDRMRTPSTCMYLTRSWRLYKAANQTITSMMKKHGRQANMDSEQQLAGVWRSWEQGHNLKDLHTLTCRQFTHIQVPSHDLMEGGGSFYSAVIRAIRKTRTTLNFALRSSLSLLPPSLSLCPSFSLLHTPPRKHLHVHYKGTTRE